MLVLTVTPKPLSPQCKQANERTRRLQTQEEGEADRKHAEAPLVAAAQGDAEVAPLDQHRDGDPDEEEEVYNTGILSIELHAVDDDDNGRAAEAELE